MVWWWWWSNGDDGNNGDGDDDDGGDDGYGHGGINLVDALVQNHIFIICAPWT
jgi:hypothetical protein